MTKNEQVQKIKDYSKGICLDYLNEIGYNEITNIIPSIIFKGVNKGLKPIFIYTRIKYNRSTYIINKQGKYLLDKLVPYYKIIRLDVILNDDFKIDHFKAVYTHDL